MRILLKTSFLTFLIVLCNFSVAQKNTPEFEKKYREAEVLENNAIYDIARDYYVESLEMAQRTKQHKKIQAKIKQKVMLMDCYEMFYHLMKQGQQLEILEDFESAHKYYSDALVYSEQENLNIQSLDSLLERNDVVERTKKLCDDLYKINLYNENEDYVKAKLLYADLKTQSSKLHHYWKKYNFQESFVSEFDSLSNFLSESRNVAQKYRHFYTDDFQAIDTRFLDEICNVACLYGDDFETDVSFEFYLDTNGVENRQIACTHSDLSFAETLSSALRHIKIQQPYRYGYSLPTEDEIVHHIVSTKEQLLVTKKKGHCKFSDANAKTPLKNAVLKFLKSAPDGKYSFVHHVNEIDGFVSQRTHFVDAKGNKARLWAKDREIVF